MWLDGSALAFAGMLGFLGFRRGTQATALGVLSLLASYGVAIVFAAPAGAALAERTGIPDLIGIAVASLALFFLSYLCFSTLAHFMQERDEDKRYGRSWLDRIGGAAIGGLLQGGLVALLLGVLSFWLEAGRTLGGLGWIPSSADSPLASLSRGVIEQAAGVVMDDDAGSRVALKMATRPGTTLGALRDLVERPEVQAVQDDAQFWLLLEDDQIDRAMNTGSFLQLTYKREIREDLSELGLVDPAGVDDPERLRSELRAVLEQLAPRVRELRNDPEIAKLVHDPVIQRAMQDGNTMALLTHPAMRRIVKRLLDAGPAPTET